MSCVVDMFMVRAKKRKVVMVGGDDYVSGDWGLSSWVELYMMCRMRMRYVRGWVGCCVRISLMDICGICSGGE